MKKFLFIFCFLLFAVNVSYGQIKFSCWFDGYWSSWFDGGTEAKITGNYDGFIIHTASEGPWDYRFRFKIDNMKFPNKKQRKKDIKANKNYEFYGTVEYYISDDYPSALENYRKNKRPNFVSARSRNGKPNKKITSKAKILVAPFKNLPEHYSIQFDNVALGIYLNGTYFPNVKFE